MVSLLLGILGSIIAWIICAEIDVWAPRLARHLLARAVKRLPIDRQERYYEEWSAHLSAMPTSLSKLVVAFGFGFAALRMRLDLQGKAMVQSVLIRGIDVTGSLFALILFGPILILVTSLIYATDRGPILIAHLRVGRDGRLFRCYKFRTMRIDAEKRLVDLLVNDPSALAEWEEYRRLTFDPRLTSLGRFLRASSLDELPQFLNVLGGTMSLVGPRPIQPADVERYGKYFKDYAAVRPGITGLWQISAPHVVSFRHRVALDTTFSRTRSVRLFLLILILTIPAVLLARGVD